MTTVSLKLPDPLLRDLEAEARRQGVSKSAVIRAELERGLRRHSARRRITCAELAGDLIGSLEGPTDLSSNSNHLAEAIIKDLKRGHRKRRR